MSCWRWCCWLVTWWSTWFAFGKSQQQSNNCSYVGFSGVVYAVDRCQSSYSRDRQSSSIFRCQADGLQILYERYNSSYNCTGTVAFSGILTQDEYEFYCHGTHDCDVSVTEYELDYLCEQAYTEEGYTDSFDYNVYVQDVCITDRYHAFLTVLYTCDDSVAPSPEFQISMGVNDSCSSNSSYQYQAGCYFPLSNHFYRINCQAGDEALPVAQYEPHYCESHSCPTSAPSPAPTRISTRTPTRTPTSKPTQAPSNTYRNHNDANSCAYVAHAGKALVPGACQVVYDVSYGYSFMVDCVTDNQVGLFFWYDSQTCEGDNVEFFANSGLEYNCIGHDRCHAKVETYDTSSNDQSCEEGDKLITRYFYATDICPSYLTDTSYQVTCKNDIMHMTAYWNESTCPKDKGALVLYATDGCSNHIESLGYRYNVDCGQNDSASSSLSLFSKSLKNVVTILSVITTVFVLVG